MPLPAVRPGWGSRWARRCTAGFSLGNFPRRHHQPQSAAANGDRSPALPVRSWIGPSFAGPATALAREGPSDSGMARDNAATRGLLRGRDWALDRAPSSGCGAPCPRAHASLPYWCVRRVAPISRPPIAPFRPYRPDTSSPPLGSPVPRPAVDRRNAGPHRRADSCRRTHATAPP